LKRLAAAASFFAVAVLASSAGADVPYVGPRQGRDYFLDPPKKGLWAHGDVLTLGVQGTLESRTPIEDEQFGTLSLRASGLAATGFSEAAAHADIRYLFFSFGMSMGYRHVFRTYEAAPGVTLSRDARNDADNDGTYRGAGWSWGEARSRLLIPLDWLQLVGGLTVRQEDAPASSFDWFHVNVHDGGILYRGDFILFARSKKLGAIGPYVRVMDFPRSGERQGELAGGFLAATRIGLKKHDDLLSLTVLARPGDDEFGFHVLRIPLWVMLVYRASFNLFDSK
jgi:hypothetical protein